MNSNMLNNFYSKNINNLQSSGIIVFETNSGELACGDLGLGRIKNLKKYLIL